MSNKKRLMAICSIAMVMLVAVGATLAYFFSEDTASNKFTTAGTDPTSGVEVTITEPGWTESNGNEMFPGDVARKDPRIVNKRGEAYARIVILLYDTTSGGTPVLITDKARADKIMQLTFYDESRFTGGVASKMDSATLAALPRINSSQFTLVTDHSFGPGVFIYDYKGAGGTNILPAGTSAQLFSGVAIPTDFVKEDLLALGNFNLDVVGQAVQVKNLTAAEARIQLDNLLTTKLAGGSATPTP